MNYIAQQINNRAAQFAEFYEARDDIEFDFSKASLPTIMLMLNYLVKQGIGKPQAIHEFLQQRGAKLSETDVTFLLEMFADGNDDSLFLAALPNYYMTNFTEQTPS